MAKEPILAQEGWVANLTVETEKSSQNYHLPIAAWGHGNLGEPYVVGQSHYAAAPGTHPWPSLIRLKDWRPHLMGLKLIRVNTIERVAGAGSMGSRMFFGTAAEPGLVILNEEEE